MTAEWHQIARSDRPGDGRLRLSVTCEDGAAREETVTISIREWGR